MQLDEHGFLSHATDWTPVIARALAQSEAITLDERHYEIIALVQQFYREYDHSPSMRPLVKYIKQQRGADKGNSIYLLTLFPESPARLACKCAGIPKPEKCL